MPKATLFIERRAPQRIGVAFAVALHTLAAAALLSYEPTRAALLSAAPVMVSLITPPKIEQPKPPEPPPPPRKPVMKRVPKPESLSLLVAPAKTPSPSPLVVPPPPPPPPAEPAPVVTAPAPLVASPVVTPPIFTADYLDNPAPTYPPRSLRNGEQGRTLLRVLVNAAGTPGEVQIHTSSGYPRLDEAARDTVCRWRFVPAKRGEEPIAAWVLVPISFRLER